MTIQSFVRVAWLKTKILEAVIYLLAGVAIASSFCAGLWDEQYGIPTFRSLFFAAPAAAFLTIYILWLRGPAVERKRKVVAAIVNCGAAAVVAYLLIWPVPPEIATGHPIVLDVVLVVCAPLSFVLAAYAIVAKSKLSHIVGTIAALLSWPYLLCLAIAPGYFPDYLYTGSLLDVFIFFGEVVCPILFLGAAVAAFRRPRLGYTAGLIAGLSTLPALAWQEKSLAGWGGNSWIILNMTPWNSDYVADAIVPLSELKIVAVALVVMAVAYSSMRLAPPHWVLQNKPLSARTWPAFALCLVVLAVWYGRSVSPYRIPIIVDAISPEMAILHVEKHGLHFHETTIEVYKDSRFRISQNDRRLFEFQFVENVAEGVLPRGIVPRVSSVALSPELSGLHTKPAKPLRAWDAEGWYVRSSYWPSSDVLAFSSEYRTAPPPGIVALFNQIGPMAEKESWTSHPMADVCLGFCYDPLAGLGIRYMNQRCTTGSDATTRCQ